MNKKLIILILACGLLWPGALRAAPVSVDGYAAAVNGDIITSGRVRDAMRPVETQIRQMYKGLELEEKLEEAYKKTLDTLIERQLILQEFKSLGRQVPENLVDARVSEILRNKFGNSVTDLMQTLEKDGMTIDEWRQQIKEQMILSFMRENAVESKVVILPRDVREAYESAPEKYRVPGQVEARMIMVQRGSTPSDLEIKRRQIEEIRRRLLRGDNFARLASEMSEGAKAAAGGYLGWIEPSSRRPELAEWLSVLAPGEISEVIETENGLYLLKVEALRDEYMEPFEKVRGDLEQEMVRKETERLYRRWMDRIKSKAFIKKY
ncbi:MAG: hypothetical protein GX608_00500 [Lentisphaerae bacterium]|nr:hypothetical protein [Lentisphaerota bacterium]